MANSSLDKIIIIQKYIQTKRAINLYTTIIQLLIRLQQLKLSKSIDKILIINYQLVLEI